MSENLHIAITGDNKGFIDALNESRRGVRQTQQQVEQSGESIEKMFSRMKTAAAGALAGFSAKEFIQKVVEVRGQFQQLEASFTTLLGSAAKAKDMMAQVADFAAKTPFDLQGVADGAKQLMAYGVQAQDVTDTLRRLGDIAAGLSLPLNDLIYLYGTTITQGRMYTQDLRQFMGRGIPLAEELAKQFGVTKDKVGELVTAGRVGSEEFIKAIKSMTDEGSQFGGLMDMQSKTITGQISNIEDAIDGMFNKIGQQSEGIINDTLSVVSSLVENYESVGKVIAALVVTYGAYKAAVMTVTAIQALQATGIGALTAAETIHYGWLVLVEKAQKLLNATMLSNPYVAVATALAGLVAVMIATSSSVSDLDAVQNTLNETTKEAEDAQRKYNEETQNAINMATSDSAATDDRRKAMNLLISRYPTIIKKYIDEEGHLKNILQLKREIAKIDGNKTVTSHLNKSSQYSNISQTLHRNGEKAISGGEISEQDAKVEEEAIKQYAKAHNMAVWRVKAFTSMKTIRKYFDDLAAAEKKQAARVNATNKANNFSDTFGSMSNKRLETLKNTLEKAKATGKSVRMQYKELQGVDVSQSDIDNMLTKVSGIQNSRKKAKTYQQDAKSARTEWQKATEDYKKLQKSKTATTAEVKKAREKVAAASKNYKDITGKTPENEDKEAAKNAKASAAKEKKEATAENQRENAEREYQNKLQDYKQQRTQLEQQLTQSTIDAEEDSAQKEHEQMIANHEKEMQDLDKQKQDYIAKKTEVERAKAKANGTTYNGTATLDKDEQDIFSKLRENLMKKHENEEKKYYRQQTQDMYDYLKEYGSFEQKRLAITEEYADKIKKARSEGEKLKLQKEEKQKLSALSYEDISMGIDWKSLFSGVGNLTSEMMQPMMEKLQAYVKTEDYAKADAQTQQAVVDLMNELRSYLGTDQSTTWKTLADALDKFNAAISKYNDAVANEKKAVNARNNAKKRLDAGEITQEEFKTYANEAQKAGDATADAREQVEQFGKELNNTSDELANYTSKLTAALNNAKAWSGVDGMSDVKTSVANIDAWKGAMDSVLPTMSDGIGKSITNGLSKTVGSGLSSIGGIVSKGLSSVVGSTVGIIAQIPKLILQIVSAIKSFVTGILNSFTELFKLRWIDDLVNSILGAVGNLINAIFDLPENIYKVLESIVVKGVGGLLNTVVGRIGNILSLGALSSKGPSDWFTNSNAKKVEETINNLTERNKLLEQSIDDLTDEIKEYRGNKAIKSSEEAEKLQKETIENYKDIAKAQAGYHGSHHSWDYYWNGFSDDQIKKFSEQIGRAWSGDIWGLSPEEMKLLRSNVDMWEQIQNTGKGGYGDRLTEKLNDYIDQAGKLQEITDQLYETLTGTTADDVFDDFLDSLNDLANGAEDVFKDIDDSWQKMVNKMVINNLVGERFQDTLKEWYEELAKLNESRSKGEITDVEYRQQLADLKKEYDNYVQDAKNDIDTMRNEGIIKPTSNSTYSQSASSGAWESLGEETGQELNGRFTALQVTGEQILDGVQSMLATVNAIYSRTDEGAITLTEIRNLMITNNAFLEDILSANKSYYEKFDRHLDRIERTR